MYGQQKKVEFVLDSVQRQPFELAYFLVSKLNIFCKLSACGFGCAFLFFFCLSKSMAWGTICLLSLPTCTHHLWASHANALLEHVRFPPPEEPAKIIILNPVHTEFVQFMLLT